MAGTLRDELASLKIDRPSSIKSGLNGHRKSSGRRGGGVLRLLSWMMWLIPLGLLAAGGVFGYRQYDKMRSRPVVKKGLVVLNDGGGSGDAPRRQGISEVALSSDDRHEDRRPSRADVPSKRG